MNFFSFMCIQLQKFCYIWSFSSYSYHILARLHFITEKIIHLAWRGFNTLIFINSLVFWAWYHFSILFTHFLLRQALQVWFIVKLRGWNSKITFLNNEIILSFLKYQEMDRNSWHFFNFNTSVALLTNTMRIFVIGSFNSSSLGQWFSGKVR